MLFVIVEIDSEIIGVGDVDWYNKIRQDLKVQINSRGENIYDLDDLDDEDDF